MSGNERFWTVVLYVVTVSYVAFCCLILGWLVAKEDSVIEALVAMGGTYGTLLTGVPVLIAVLVARQQLEANRRQHVATVKRSFKDQIDAQAYARSYLSSFQHDKLSDLETNSDPEEDGLGFWKLTDDNLLNIVNLNKKITSKIETIRHSMAEIDFEYATTLNISGLMQCRYDWVRAQSKVALMLIDEEERKMQEYWS